MLGSNARVYVWFWCLWVSEYGESPVVTMGFNMFQYEIMVIHDDWMTTGWLGGTPKTYNVGPPNVMFDGVYKPHEYYSYRYHKP